MHEVTSETETPATAAFPSPTWETLELRRTIARTQEAVGALGLTTAARERVNRSLDSACEEAAVEKPDRYEVGEHLAAAATALKEDGALKTGTSVIQALRRATELLGPAGLATIEPAL